MTVPIHHDRTPEEQAEHDRRNAEAVASYKRQIAEMTAALPPIPPIPWTSPEEIALSPFGVALDVGYVGEPLSSIYGARAHDIRGVGLTVPNDGRALDWIIQHCYVGAKLASSDAEISRCRLFNHRDACLWIAAGAGNCQSTNNHCYGARIACYVQGPWYRATQDTYADALIGYWGDGGESTLTNILFQHNSCRDALLRGGEQHLVNCIVNVQREVKVNSTFNVPGMQPYAGKVGIELGGACSIRGGFVSLLDWKHPANEYSGRPAEAIWIVGDDTVIDTNLAESDNIDGSVGVRIKGARHGVRIDCNVRGFSSPKDRIVVVDDAANCDALDITLRINGMVKPIGGYIDIGAGWTGSVRLIDTAKGKTLTLPEGKAA